MMKQILFRIGSMGETLLIDRKIDFHWQIVCDSGRYGGTDMHNGNFKLFFNSIKLYIPKMIYTGTTIHNVKSAYPFILEKQ